MARTDPRLKVLSGTIRPDRDGVTIPPMPEFGIVDEFPEPPQHLTPDGVAMWNKLGRELVASKALQVVDLYAFEQLCYAWQQFRKKAKADMEITASENNSLKGLFDAFGLNASARRRIAGGLGEAPKKNKFSNNAAKRRA